MAQKGAGEASFWDGAGREAGGSGVDCHAGREPSSTPEWWRIAKAAAQSFRSSISVFMYCALSIFISSSACPYMSFQR